MSRIRVAVAPDVRPLARTIGRLGPELRVELQDESNRISAVVADRIRVAAAAAPRQGHGMGPSVRAPRSTVARVKAGGGGTFRPKSKKHGKRAKFSQVLWGSEFGGSPGHSWPPRRRDGYWFRPTVLRSAPWAVRQWLDAADRLFRSRVG